ncbi:winged helix-turn-helix transcriptional regulator [Metallosphaera tengchongensis]|uniref:Winged helix-turn-helix transcriptional regulator n=2 Tax=Metallosphaera tengchongensis TaxID=1532350 RepID=A0A6N0NZZ6_9CREN|nr:winged helix-turn-helix transcriptional regulator [Metallosphaera tengchongensis]
MRKLDEVVSGKGWETRKRILEELISSPKTPYDLAKRLNLNYSTVRYHLDLLESSGLVTHVKEGSKQIFLPSKSLTALKII